MTFDDDDNLDGEILYEGPTSVVNRVESDFLDGPRFIAVKTSTTVHAKEPHDIIKEARLLASFCHLNIIPLIKHELSEGSQNLGLWMPYLPYSLNEVLQSSRFSPNPIISFGSTAPNPPTAHEVQFTILAKSIIFQVLCGMSYLHSEDIRVAHRDIKPSNVLLSASGCAQLIDFGIAFRVGEDRTAKARDLWPESTARMYFEVSTGPYRAPELLFGSRTYDALAIDAWSLGATFAEFFTSLRLQTEEDDETFSFQMSNSTPESGSGSDSGIAPREPTPPPTPFVIPQGTSPRPRMPTGRWTRMSLFDGTRGEIGLAWSIFKIRGTPNADSWPSFLTLPDASKLSFVDVPPIDLASQLPNLPPSTTTTTTTDVTTHAPSPSALPTPLDLVHRFLVYEPARRLHPLEALGHPWFRADPVVVLPADSAEDDETGHPALEMGPVTRSFTLEGQTRTLGDILLTYVVSRES